MNIAAIDAPYDRLEPLPRAVWLHGVVTSAGRTAQRLADIARWLADLDAGRLPAPDADFGDSQATAPLRQAVAELELPSLSTAAPAFAEQVLRTLLWHLDRIVDLQPRLTRAQAIAAAAEEFRAQWQLETQGLEASLALLQDLGQLAELRWDELRGHLRSRPWREAQAAAERLQRLPALAELIRRLGRTERSVAADLAPDHDPGPGPTPPVPLRPVHTTLPEAPGEIVGIRLSGRIEHMLASEAVMLHHPVLQKLWRARHAEARLLSFDTSAELVDWRADPDALALHNETPHEPKRREHGPIILCLDTSGSMRGAPEAIAKAIVIAALRAAHDRGRGCVLIAFGGAGEVVERELGRGGAGLQALMDLMGQGFDGGTDVQTPIERAIARVHEARWRSADLLIVSDGEFGCVPRTLRGLDDARTRFGLRVQGVLVGDRETMGLLEVCDHIHWEREWRRFADADADNPLTRTFSPVHSRSLTALYFPNALSDRAAKHRGAPDD
jgi:uncharacterized protein with von Willebrand factor type A (vWA) domain